MSLRPMAFATPKYSRGRVDRAGNVLRAIGMGPDAVKELGVPTGDDFVRLFEETSEVVDNWRAAHSYPMFAMRMTMTARAKKIDPEAIVAQRLKRLPTIIDKLGRQPGMQLSRMHDIGGCRAVLRDVRAVHALVEAYRQAEAKAPNRGPVFVDMYDYIASPKADGYRSIHLVYKYRPTGNKQTAYAGLRIELQLRSRLQHAWATAVETVGIFLGQALKSNQGETDWLRFFALMGSVIALRERRPRVPGTPDGVGDLKAELQTLCVKLDVMSRLKSYSTTVSTTQATAEMGYYLLVLDREHRTTSVRGFKHQETAQATNAYREAERLAQGTGVEVVLVSVDRVDALKRAYPNFFLDAARFASLVQSAIA
jgi:hypothetical protein